jgi:hypothetical protein
MTTGGQPVPDVREALFPSPQLRAIPSFSFDIPPGWELEESAVALAAVHPREPVDGFWVNVLVNHSRVEAAIDLEQAAVVTFRQLRRRDPNVEVVTERIAHYDHGRRDTYLRIVETTDDDGRRVAQIHALFFAPRITGARTADLFQLIGTVPQASLDEHGPPVIEIVNSFRFEPGPRSLAAS